MSAMHHVPTRHSPPPVRKKSALKTARSVPVSGTNNTGGTSSRGALTPRVTVKGTTISTSTSTSTSSSSTSPSSSSAKSKHRRHHREADDDGLRFDSDGDDDMATFLQYCAMCEKQIVVPNSSILYCSESCRRRDASTPPSCDPSTILFSLTSPTHKAKTFTNRPPTIEEHLNMYHLISGPATPPPASKPSGSYPPHPHTGIKEARIPPLFHDGKADLDPTEWKPADKGSASEDEDHCPSSSASSISPSTTTTGSLAGSWKPKLPHRQSSDASAYLSQFHSASSDSLASATSGRRATATAAHAPPLTSKAPRTSSRSTDRDASGAKSYDMKARASAASLPTTALTVVTSGSSSGTANTGTSDSLSSSASTSPSSSSTSVEDALASTGAGGAASAGKHAYSGLHLFDRHAAATALDKTTGKKPGGPSAAARPIKAKHPASPVTAASFAPAARGSLKKLLSG